MVTSATSSMPTKRAEMWGTLREKLPYLALPDSADLRDQLIGPEFKFNLKGEIQLEKRRICESGVWLRRISPMHSH